MLGRILLPLDAEDLAARAAPAVLPLLRRPEAEVVVLRVVAPREIGRFAPPGASALTRARRQAEKLRRMLSRIGVRARARVTVGEPAPGILEFARVLRPDLIVLATHGRRGVARLLESSVAEAVLREAESPVVIVTAGVIEAGVTARMRRILVPLDGSERATEVLPLASELANAQGGELVLVHVREQALPAAHRVEALEEGRALLRRFEDRATAPTRLAVTAGRPAVEILNEVEREGADLIAMTTHGHRGLRRLLLGSVAAAVARRAPCPVLALKATVRDSRRARRSLETIL